MAPVSTFDGIVSGKGEYLFVRFFVASSLLVEPRFGLDKSDITRVYYMVLPDQHDLQGRIDDALKVRLLV